MHCVRHIPLAVCVLLVACGGKLATGEGTGSTNGSAGTLLNVGTTTGGVIIVDPGQMGSAGAFGTGGGPTTSACGPVTCGPGLVCCNASCGVCTLPDQACDAIACAVPSFDAGAGPVIDSGAPCPGGGGVGPGDQSDYGNPWKSSFFITGCQTKAGHDCITIPNCPNGGAANFEDRGSVVTEVFPIGGSVCTTYSVTFQVNGIVEAKYYQGGTRDAGDVVPPNVDSADIDMFYRGGTPVVSNYGVLRMRILDPFNKKELARYYLNSGVISAGMESHRTFHISYSKTIDVPGGGFVEYLTQDSNCHSIDNCGDGNVSDTECNAARGIPHEEANPLPAMGIDPNPANDINGKHKLVPLATLNSVNGSTKPWHSQIVHLTITKAVAK